MDILDGLEQICPKCIGKGKYEDYDSEKVDKSYSRYMDVEMKDAKTAWSLALSEHIKTYDCDMCSKKGKVVTEKGKQILTFIKEYS